MQRATLSEHVLRRRYRTLAQVVPSARRGDPEGIHQARVATRRLREALRAIGAGGAGRRAVRKVRRVTRLLGPVRELDVALALLGEAEAAGSVAPSAASVLREAIGRERAALHREVQRSLSADVFAHVPRRVLRAVRERTAPPGAGTPALRLAAARARRLQWVLDNAGSLYLPDRLHDVRIATKKLRYACEILHECGHPVGHLIGRLKRTQDLLGRMHDLEVLILRVRGVQASPLATGAGVSRELERFVRCLETDCRRLHGRYVKQRAGLDTGCAQVAARAAVGTAVA